MEKKSKGNYFNKLGREFKSAFRSWRLYTFGAVVYGLYLFLTSPLFNTWWKLGIGMGSVLAVVLVVVEIQDVVDKRKKSREDLQLKSSQKRTDPLLLDSPQKSLSPIAKLAISNDLSKEEFLKRIDDIDKPVPEASKDTGHSL